VCRREIRPNRSPVALRSAVTSYAENRYFAYKHKSILFASYLSVLLKRILTAVVSGHVIPCYLQKITEASEKRFAFVVRVGTDISSVHPSILIATVESTATPTKLHSFTSTRTAILTVDAMRSSNLLHIQAAGYHQHSSSSLQICN
jgi:hypothetical protein